MGPRDAREALKNSGYAQNLRPTSRRMTTGQIAVSHLIIDMGCLYLQSILHHTKDFIFYQ